MHIEKRIVKKEGELSPKTKAKLVALLGLSAAFSISAFASPQEQKESADSTKTASTVSPSSSALSSSSSLTSNDTTYHGPIGGEMDDIVSEDEVVNSLIRDGDLRHHLQH
jgi:cytoskeletal protein RodZ